MIAPVTVRRALAQSGLVPVDAHALLGHVLGRNRAWMSAHGEEAIEAAQAAAFLALAKRRRDGEPVAYLTGIREFWGLSLAVSPAVLIPRPETESLVELALSRLPVDRDLNVLDLGTGSGAIALAIAHERPRVRVLATDASTDALSIARDNARRLGLRNVEFARSDWYADLPSESQAAVTSEGPVDVTSEGPVDVASNAPAAPFDLIACNPPYVSARDSHLSDGDLRFEPAAALTPGGDGLAALRTIVAGARPRLAPGGTLVVEHGYDQSDAVRELFAAAGFAEIVAARDLAGIPRIVAGRAP